MFYCRFNELGKPVLSIGDPNSTIHVWMAFGKFGSYPSVMVNLDNTSSFRTVLDDFLFPCMSEFLPLTGQAASRRILCEPKNLNVWNEWASDFNVSLIILPPSSSELYQCNAVFQKILQSIGHFKIVSKEMLWIEIANSFDWLTLSYNGFMNHSIFPKPF